MCVSVPKYARLYACVRNTQEKNVSIGQIFVPFAFSSSRAPTAPPGIASRVRRFLHLLRPFYKTLWPVSFRSVKIRYSFCHMNRSFHFRTSSSELGPLEERLLEALWQRANATVRELADETCPDLAYTTVMTTLDRLFKKNLLSREVEGRAFRYTPLFTREQIHREAAGAALRQLLDASPVSSLPLSYLVEIVTERDAQLLDELSEAVEAKRRQLRGLRSDHSQGSERLGSKDNG
jgi:predicted transcriptional regulator